MRELLFSVIIPVYNTRRYLQECLQSAVGQTLEDAEFICIDDGSTDGCAEILAAFAQKDARVRVIRQKNAGLSAARNRGMEAAQGEYLCFLDSDDLLMCDALEMMRACILQERPDMVLFECEVFCTPQVREIPPDILRRSRAYAGRWNGEQLYVDMYRAGDYRCMVWSQCMRRAFAEEKRLRFDAGLLYEDELFSLRAMLAAESVRHLYRPLYRYRQRSDSIVNSPRSLLKLISKLHIALEEAGLCVQGGISSAARFCVLDAAKGMLKNVRSEYAGYFSDARSSQAEQSPAQP